MSLAASPIRFPDVASRTVMTRRAWWLVVLNFLIPGSAQVLAGDRKLGRFGLGATLTLWFLAVAALVVWIFWPAVLYTVFSTTITLWVVAAVLAFYAVLWVVLTLDTLRLVRLVKTAPSARAWVAALSVVVMVAISGTAAYGAYLATTASGFLVLGVRGGTERAADRRPLQLPPARRRRRARSRRPPARQHQGREHRRRDRAGGDDRPARATWRTSRSTRTRRCTAVYPEGYGAIDGCEVDVCLLNSIYTEVELMSPEMYPDAVAAGQRARASRPCATPRRASPGCQIQYYVLIDMQGFQQLIDALGGVDDQRRERVRSAADEDQRGRGTEWIEPGEQHLDGYHALWYARSRYGHAATTTGWRARPAPGGDPRTVQPGERALQVPGGRRGRRAGREDRHPAGHARLLRRPRLEDEGAADHRRVASCPTTAWTPRSPTRSTSASSSRRPSRRRPRSRAPGRAWPEPGVLAGRVRSAGGRSGGFLGCPPPPADARGMQRLAPVAHRLEAGVAARRRGRAPSTPVAVRGATNAALSVGVTRSGSSPASSRTARAKPNQLVCPEFVPW